MWRHDQILSVWSWRKTWRTFGDLFLGSDFAVLGLTKRPFLWELKHLQEFQLSSFLPVYRSIHHHTMVSTVSGFGWKRLLNDSLTPQPGSSLKAVVNHLIGPISDSEHGLSSTQTMCSGVLNRHSAFLSCSRPEEESFGERFEVPVAGVSVPLKDRWSRPLRVNCLGWRTAERMDWDPSSEGGRQQERRTSLQSVLLVGDRAPPEAWLHSGHFKHSSVTGDQRERSSGSKSGMQNENPSHIPPSLPFLPWPVATWKPCWIQGFFFFLFAAPPTVHTCTHRVMVSNVSARGGLFPKSGHLLPRSLSLNYSAARLQFAASLTSHRARWLLLVVCLSDER